MSTAQPNKIGVVTATIIGMNAMIGAGIFAAPSVIAAYVGPAGILAYVIVVFSVWLMALSLARLAQLYPQPGSFYTYASQWSGHIGGIIACSAYFIGLLIAMGLLAQMAGHHLQPFFPSYSADALGLISLFTLVALNMFGVVMSELGQQILIACTVFPLVVTTIMCFTKAHWNYLTPFAPHGFTNVFKATRIVIFGFFGFECATSLFSIVENPARNVPRALTYSIAIVGVLYILFITSIIVSTPLHYFTSPYVLLPDILRITFPSSNWVIVAVHVSTLSAILGTIHSMIWGSSSLLIELLKRVQNTTTQTLLASGRINQRTAVLFVGVCILLSYLMLKNPDLFFYLTAAFIIVAFILSMITLLTIPDEWKSGRNITTLCGITTALVIFMFAVEGLVQELNKVIG